MTGGKERFKKWDKKTNKQEQQQKTVLKMGQYKRRANFRGRPLFFKALLHTDQDNNNNNNNNKNVGTETT